MTRKTLIERSFSNSLSPIIEIVMLQKHKLRGHALDNLGGRLMPECASWILKTEPGERSWLNPNAAGKGRVGLLLAQKYARFVTDYGALYGNRIVWIKMEGIEARGETLKSHVFMRPTFQLIVGIYGT